MVSTDIFALFLCTTCVGICVFLVFDFMRKPKGEKETALSAIKALLYDQLLEADRKWGVNIGTGEAKKSFVVGLVLNCSYYINLPTHIKAIINATTIGGMIDQMVKDLLRPAMAKNPALQQKIAE